ncbi:MAG: GDSL-type esterase/lipase family protein, partial [Myxococcales bacterium]
MTRSLAAKVLLATAVAFGGACSPADGVPSEGSGGRASGGTTGTGGGSGGTLGTGGATGGEATGGQTTAGTGGIEGTPEQTGGRSGTGGAATGGRSSGGVGGTSVTGGSTGSGGVTSPGTGGAPGTAGAGGTVAYAPCPTNGTPCKILPLGDSITEGARSSDDAGYRSQLFKSIVAAKQKVTFTGSLTNGPTQVSGQTFPRMHEGHGGWTIDPGISEFSGYDGISTLIPTPALNGGPHIILLHIGANEVFTKDKDTMSTRLDALVEKIAKNAPSALIVLAQITPVGTSNSGHTQAQVTAANAAQMQYNSKIPAIIQAHAAKGQHIIGVDMSKMPLSDLGTATLHPNDQGYAYMAGIWYAG